MISLFLGGARSGKSKHAETRALAAQSQVIYIATGQAGDHEMAERIQHHRTRRPVDWDTLETPLYLSKAVQDISQENQSSESPMLIIDCMTLWLSNWLCDQPLDEWLEERSLFLASIQSYEGDIAIVSNEVGSGIVPLGELSRLFVDQAGWLNQSLAEIADRVELVVAGLPLRLK